MTIDLDTLREMRATAERMAPYYQRGGDRKRAENAAMEGAGLKPLHADFNLLFADDEHARCKREAEVLRHVLAYHEGRVYVPGEVGA